jgi:hypothetical protein
MEKSRVYNSIAVKMPKRKQREDEEPTLKRCKLAIHILNKPNN